MQISWGPVRPGDWIFTVAPNVGGSWVRTCFIISFWQASFFGVGIKFPVQSANSRIKIRRFNFLTPTYAKKEAKTQQSCTKITIIGWCISCGVSESNWAPCDAAYASLSAKDSVLSWVTSVLRHEVGKICALLRHYACPETSVSNYHYTLRNVSEERRSHLLRGGSLKSRNCLRNVWRNIQE